MLPQSSSSNSNLKRRQLHSLQGRHAVSSSDFTTTPLFIAICGPGFASNRRKTHVLENRLSNEVRLMNYHSIGKMKAISQPAFQIWWIEVWDHSAT
jgi:hypothetical protein